MRIEECHTNNERNNRSDKKKQIIMIHYSLRRQMASVLCELDSKAWFNINVILCCWFFFIAFCLHLRNVHKGDEREKKQRSINENPHFIYISAVDTVDVVSIVKYRHVLEKFIFFSHSRSVFVCVFSVFIVLLMNGLKQCEWPDIKIEIGTTSLQMLTNYVNVRKF